MGKRIVAGAFLAGLAGLGAVAAVQARDGGPFAHGPGMGGFHGRWNALSPDDRAAFTDARIAAIRAGIRLTPDQEKLWPPVETALRDLAKQREDQREARRARREADKDKKETDAPERIRAMGDAAIARGEALRKLADASAPLFATLDEGQKRRAELLARPMRPHWGHKSWRRGGDDQKE